MWRCDLEHIVVRVLILVDRRLVDKIEEAGDEAWSVRGEGPGSRSCGGRDLQLPRRIFRGETCVGPPAADFLLHCLW